MKDKPGKIRRQRAGSLVLRDGQKNFVLQLDGFLSVGKNASDPRAMTRDDVTSAEPIIGAREWVDRRILEGHYVCIFTSRPENLRAATLSWLKKNHFKFHSLVMGRPVAQHYHYIDDRHVQATKFGGRYTELVRKQHSIQVFG